LCSCGNVG